jgi:GT2 family glycosyltransferase
VHLPQVEVWHGQGQSANAVSAGARIEYWRSRYQYFSKNHKPLLPLLRIGLCTRLAADWLFSGLMAIGSVRWRNKWQVYSALIRWHLRGCPANMGLPR